MYSNDTRHVYCTRWRESSLPQEKHVPHPHICTHLSAQICHGTRSPPPRQKASRGCQYISVVRLFITTYQYLYCSRDLHPREAYKEVTTRHWHYSGILILYSSILATLPVVTANACTVYVSINSCSERFYSSTCLVHLNGGDKRAPPLPDDVHRALDGRELARERGCYARVSDLSKHRQTSSIDYQSLTMKKTGSIDKK